VSDYLIDTNILVRLVLPQDPLNPVAAGAVDELKRRGDKTCVAAQNLIEFWRVIPSFSAVWITDASP
jgi:predicted nucleic-acid-binding protein